MSQILEKLSLTTKTMKDNSKDGNTHYEEKPYTQNQIIDKLTSQKETLKMAEHFSQRELTLLEKIVGSISAIILYGIGFGMLIYILLNLDKW